MVIPGDINQTPKLSIVVPVLNNKIKLEKTLESIINQTCNSIEILIIDGGSTDGTLDIIKQYEAYIGYWESGLDSGISDAFNRGIMHAKGSLIAILNSGDTWLPNTCDKVLEYYKRFPTADILYGAIQYFDPVKNYTYIRNPDLGLITRRMTLYHPSIVITAECYREVGMYLVEYTHAMDSEWIHRAIAQRRTFIEVPHVLSQMELGGISDKEYLKSLKQYRDSVILHDLMSKKTAYAYYYFYALIKSLFRLEILRPIKKIRDRNIAKKITLK